MCHEARSSSIWRFRSVIGEVTKSHDGWVANEGYTIASDHALDSKLAKEHETTAERLETTGTAAVQRLSELRLLTESWNTEKRIVLQQYVDTANTKSMIDLSPFLILNEDWLALSQEEKGIAPELWKLEDKVSNAKLWRKPKSKPQIMVKTQTIPDLRTALKFRRVPRICAKTTSAVLK